MLYFTTCRVVLTKEGLALPPPHKPFFPAVKDDTSIESVFSTVGTDVVHSSPACSTCTSLSLDGAVMASFPELVLPRAHHDLLDNDFPSSVDIPYHDDFDLSSLFSNNDVACFLMDSLF